MPLTLDTPVVVSDTITQDVVKSFTFDDENQLMYVVYDRKNASNQVVVSDAALTLQPAEVITMFARVKTLIQGGANAYPALLQAVHEQLPSPGTYA